MIYKERLKNIREENEVKHIKARTNGTTILLNNGEVYTCRFKYKCRIRNKK